MSFGFGVGDFIKILELGIEARKRFVDAPSQYDDISSALKNFSNIVQDIDVLLWGCEPEPEQKASLQHIKDDSSSLLKDLLVKLDETQDIGASSTGKSGRVRKAWKRITWDPAEIATFRSRLSLNLEMLNAIERQLSSQRSSRIREGVDRLTERSNQQKQDEIFQWTGTIDYGSRHSNALERREDGTGEWLLQSNEFGKWLQTKGELLFCPGLPGAGKTILASVIIQHLLDTFQTRNDVGLGYHYCDFRQQGSENTRVILASILRQLAQCQGYVPEVLTALYKKHNGNNTRPSIRETVDALKSVTTFLSRVFIVIDGLDECPRWRELLAQLRGLGGANILVTSRTIPEIVNDQVMEGRSVLEIRATKADVRQYLRHNMSKLSKFVMCDQELQEQICEAILGSIGGMFLLARLHLDSLVGKRSVKALKQALASLPKGSSAYDKAYLDAMNRIECQVPDLESLAKEVLAWLTFARRPLQIAELQAAIAIQETDSELDYESLIDIDDLVSICAGLVTIEPQSQTVTLTLIHYTTQEYLERTQARWRPDAHAAIATSCFTYLSFPALDVDFLKLDEYCFGKHIDGKLFPLLSYCIDHGALHAWRAMSEPPSIAHFLSSETKMPRNWLLLIAKHGGAPQAEATAEWLIERDVCINTRDPCNLRTILHYAVLNGWMRCVELMLQRNARLETDCFNMTPFHYTVKDNAQYMAQVFLDACITVDLPVTRRIYESTYQEGRVVYLPSNCVQTPIGETPTGKGLTGLHLATLTGCRQMTKFLLDHGADPNFPSDYGETPLHLALRQGFNNFESRVEDFWNNSDCRIECAIEYIDSTESDEECCSTQDWIEESRSTIVSLLLARADIDINAQDISGISPLHIAACSRWPSQSTIHKLLEKEAKVSLQTKEGKTPLHLAIENKNMDHFTALLRFGANPMDTSVNGLNALHYAARKVQMEMVEYLVSSISSTCREGFLKARDKHGETALHHLLRSRSPSSIIAVEYFLQRSVDVNDLNNAEMSPMATYLNTFVFCRGNDNAEVLRLLFENGADPTFETRDGLGLARLAARSRRVSPSLLKVLARRGVDIMAKDRQGRTVLHHMAIKGTLTEDVLHYICDDNRLFMEIQDTCQKTALDYAVEMQKKENRLSAFESNRRKRTEELLRKSRG